MRTIPTAMRQAPYLDFPLSEYRLRLDKYRMALESGGFDAAILSTRDSVEHGHRPR